MGVEKLLCCARLGAASFIKTYLAVLFVITVKGEMFVLSLRIWSEEPLTFWDNGLWQVNFILALLFTLFYYVSPNTLER
ncbi:hypothetical protein K6Q96_21625 [Grimontia kaedaensis]|uniref:Uncharacterized protein n=1 Tax=Grimontia kaedaensis TaxID=2872157 RepID=A0ABY4WZE0_9GAMM|nr:hypothetical protein [Grimontia kaedaensis]USH04341.1 hypothetical protein K6Q96_21625 [Grimontia kaedaensis]